MVVGCTGFPVRGCQVLLISNSQWMRLRSNRALTFGITCSVKREREREVFLELQPCMYFLQDGSEVSERLLLV